MHAATLSPASAGFFFDPTRLLEGHSAVAGGNCFEVLHIDAPWAYAVVRFFAMNLTRLPSALEELW